MGTDIKLQNLKLLQFAISQKWNVKIKHFLNSCFLNKKNPLEKDVNFKCQLPLIPSDGK